MRFRRRLFQFTFIIFLSSILIFGCSDSTDQKDISFSTPNPAVSSTKAWAQEVSYEKLIQIPEIREILRRHATMAKKSMTAEEYMALCDKVSPLGSGSTEKFMSTTTSIANLMGLKTGKERSENFSIPPGLILVSALCSLARHGQTLRQVQQFQNGCLLEAVFPSDLFSTEGTIILRVLKVGDVTRVDAMTAIKGQLFDWGKSKRYLEELFSDLRATPI